MPQISSISDFKPYKYKDLKIYSSTEWLADNRKKYRQVFEEKAVKYIYIDLSLINKLYDRENWDLKLSIKCYRLHKGKNEVCTLEIDRQVSKHDHIIHVREGWGNKKTGSFWKKGKYCWEVYEGETKLATKYFHIEDLASISGGHPETTLKVESIDYYEGTYDQPEKDDDHVYYTQFDSRNTRYVFVELMLENRLHKKHEWYAEIFIRFYNESRDLKGEVVRLERIKKGEDKVVVNAGWGSNVKGSWRAGKYLVEVIYQNRLIAYSHFEIAYSFKEGFNDVEYPEYIISTENQIQEKKYKSRKALEELNKLIGLKSIKRQIHDHTKYIKFLQLRKERGFEEAEKITLHSVFVGNPGTGKTTVARMLGSIYKYIGLLSSGHVHEVSRVDLVGEYIGQTAPKVKDAIEKAKGGVLFIDEAYSLARSNEDSKDFGREVIELLIKEMSHPNCDFMVVVAGYPQEMDTFIQSNPGLASRFKYTYDFPDYQLSELLEIMEYFCEDYQITFTDRAMSEIREIIQDAYRNRSKNFGNARYIAQLLEKAKIQMGIRLMSQPKKEWTNDELKRISLKDVIALSPRYRAADPFSVVIDEEELSAAMAELNALIGLRSIKKKISELVDIVRYRVDQGEMKVGVYNMHAVLTGNPGTGKTTVTRICAKIFKALGVLERGHMVETDRQGLIAGYVGQTAIKTAKKIDEATGGLLFIDEAYALLKKGAHNDFGDEAIQVLLKQMEDRRGEFYVFAAGYPEQMNDFLNMNPGLKSRFDIFLNFEDFNPEELTDIAKYFLNEKQYKISSDALSLLSRELKKEYEERDKQFGNARRVRIYIDEIIKYQNLRLADERHYSHNNYSKLIKIIDVEQACASIQQEYQYRRQSIGF